MISFFLPWNIWSALTLAGHYESFCRDFCIAHFFTDTQSCTSFHLEVISSDFWYTIEIDDGCTLSEGLWKWCFTCDSDSYCEYYNEYEGKWVALCIFAVSTLISGFRWSFYEISDVGVGLSLSMILLFLGACIATVWWIFKTGYRFKS